MEDIGGKIEAELDTDQKTNGVVLPPCPLIDLPVRLTMVKKAIYQQAVAAVKPKKDSGFLTKEEADLKGNASKALE